MVAAQAVGAVGVVWAVWVVGAVGAVWAVWAVGVVGVAEGLCHHVVNHQVRVGVGYWEKQQHSQVMHTTTLHSGNNICPPDVIYCEATASQSDVNKRYSTNNCPFTLDVFVNSCLTLNCCVRYRADSETYNCVYTETE